jgi:iron uptake system component EfeO
VTRARRVLALAAVLPLAIAGAVACGDDNSSASSSGGSEGGGTVEVAITEAGCEPARLEIPAGPTNFEVENKGAGNVTEFEVLDGDRVLGEAENIADGLTGSFSINLKAGEYVTYCPNGTTSERGTLVVTGGGGTAEANAEQAKAVSAYRDYLRAQTALLVARVTPFVAAVQGGDRAEAKRLFPVAREPYERIEPVAESFGDLDPQIDARAGDVPAEQWGGFHKLEKVLWSDQSLDSSGPVAAKLLADTKKLQALVEDVELQPAQVANGAKSLLDEVSASKITGEEDRYSHTDLWDFAANVAGAKVAFESVRPLLATSDADLATTIDTRFRAVETALEPYRQGGGYVLYTALTPKDTRQLSRVIDSLAEPLSTVAAAVNT